jgi:hypothetical protein
MRERVLYPALLGGLVAGTVDIAAPALIYMVSPLVILTAISAGILGREASRANEYAWALGLILQWLMSIVIALIFCAAATRLKWMTQRWIISGLSYGVAVFFVMNYVVVPLSAVAKMPSFTARTFVLNLLAMLVFGLIVAWFAQRAAKRTTPG